MIISVLTLFPKIFEEVFNTSILKRAQKKNKVSIRLINIRDFAHDKHKTVDDRPFGGGVGMLLKIDVVYKALQKAKLKSENNPGINEKIVLLDPTGRMFNQKKAQTFSKIDHLILICGHYEGVDSRIDNFIDEKISIGKYILTGGELPACVIVDATVRLLPGVLEKPEAIRQESFSEGIRSEPPQYTRPEEFMGFKVPPVLVSGDHKKISQWKLEKTLKK